MERYSLSREAEADLDDIFRYSIETLGLKRAERYYLALGECLQRVAETPVFVVRVLHLTMDLKRHLPE